MQTFVARTQNAGQLNYALWMGEELKADTKFGSILTYGVPIARTLGRTYFQLGRYNEAVGLLETSALTERSPWRPLWRPVQRAFLFIDFAYLGDAYRKLGRVSESRRILELGLALKFNSAKVHDPAQAARAAVRGELGFTVMAEGKFSEAETLFRHALKEYDAEPSAVNRWDLHRPRARIVIGLGQALAGQGKFAEAEPVVTEGISTLMADRKTLRGDPTLKVREALEAVVQVYRAAGKPEKAAEWEVRREEL
jgi:tetratricopeptide (TPR) repeat protein